MRLSALPQISLSPFPPKRARLHGLQAPLLIALLLAPLSSLATPLGVFEGRVAQFLLGETAEGRLILDRVLAGRLSRASESVRLREALSELHQPHWNAERAELETALRNAERAIGETPAATGGTSSARTRALSAEQRLFLEIEAAKNLRVNPEWGLRDLSPDPIPGEISFTPSESLGGSRAYGETRARFLEGSPVDPARNPIGPSIDTPGAASRARAFVRRMNECVRSRPAEVTKAKDFQFMLQGIGISELFTVGGYIAAAGEGPVDWRNLPTDVLITGLWGFISNYAVSGSPNLWVRWVRVVGMGEARSAVDATFYYVTPIKDLHGQDLETATLNRWKYNATWNLGSSPVNVGLYALVSGLECIYGSRVAVSNFGIRMAVSAGTSYAYFRLRNATLAQPNH